MLTLVLPNGNALPQNPSSQLGLIPFGKYKGATSKHL